jgi:salicylate hydroxylase
MSTPSPAREPLLIAGAGIGGLTTAVALSRRSIPSVVIERAADLAPVGSGLQLSPNAVHVLRRLGLEEALLPHAVEPRAVSIQSGESGRPIAEVPLGNTVRARYGAPYLVIHRADLQGVLLEAAKLSAGITLTFGTGLLDARQTDDRVRLTTERNGLSDIVAGSGLVAADGVWSTVRRKVMNIRQAVYSGRTAYRAVIPIDDVPKEWRDVTGLWMGRDAHVVHYPVSGGKQFNIVVIVKEDWREETWSAPAHRGALLSRFARWSPRCRALLERPESWLKWALCGMDPGMRWVDGRIALLGDSAHAMLPFAAQGAAMSIEDADALARAVDTTRDLPEAFAAYESARHGRAERVMRLARENDRIYHMGGPMAFARDVVMRTLSPERLLARLDWLYGWQPPQDA